VSHPEQPFPGQPGIGDRPPEPSLAWLGVGEAAELSSVAEIWATVELERALADLGAHAERAGPRAAAVGEPLLGARVLVLRSDVAGEPPVALAEPSSEGRLAATLARHGEGPAGRYVTAPVGLDVVRRLAAVAGIAISRAADGPFGSEVLVLDRPVTGPHLILVEPAAVPSGP
jgi:hypothetical protein